MNKLQNKLVPELRFEEFEGEWKEKLIGTILTVGSGKDYKQLNSGDIPVYGTGGYMLSVDKYLHDGESVCIGRKGTIDKPMLLKGKFWTVDTLFFTHSYNENYTKFIFLLFQNINWKKYNEASGVPSLSKATIEKIKVVLPLPEEQQKIANFLKAVDQRISLLKQKKAALETYKKGLMQQIFSQETRFKDENGDDYPGWEEKRLGDVAKFSKGKGLSKADISETGINLCIRYGELYTKYSEVIDVVFSRTNLDIEKVILSKKYDVIIPSSGESHIDIATASCVLRDGIVLGGDLNIIRSEINGVFLAYYLNNYKKHEIASLSQGISVVHLYSTHLSQLKLEIPSSHEQQKIADCLSSMDLSINKLKNQLEQTTHFKKGLLQKMFV